MSIETIVESITVAAGCFCMYISGWLSLYFYKVRKPPLTTALSVMMGGECFVLGITTLFAFLALTGHLDQMGYWRQTLMRWGMYVAASGSSYYLYRKVRQIETGD